MSSTLFGPETLAHTIPPVVEIYTDGGCDPNPGPGGWGAIIRWSDREWVLRGSDPDTTNNRMELHAAAAALAVLEGLLGRCQIDLYTDSEYLRQGITEWIDDWVGRGWQTKSRQPVKNQDLWRVLHRLTQAHDVTWHWLEGHAGHPLNERADRLATQAREALRRATTCAAERAEAREAAGAGPEVEIAVKSAARGSDGPAGWGAVLRKGEHVKLLSDAASSTTANAMLIRGTTAALRALNRPCRVMVTSDADYLIKGASQWVEGWQARGWQTRSGQPVANREAWEALLEAAARHQVTWVQARGEEAPPDLDRAGELAAEAVAPDSTD